MKYCDVEDMLVRHGVKPTPQRMVIAEFLIGTRCHPTADEVFQAVAEKLPIKLSRATVYNTLNALVEARVIKEVFTEPGRSRYDANVSEHHHFVDTNTGEIRDISPEEMTELAVRLPGNFKVDNFHITFFGQIQESKKS